MKKNCAISGREFLITDADQRFYEKMGVPLPSLCPEERSRRRLAFRNERSLYHRPCDGTGKKIISLHSPEKPYPVYENDYWWGDTWDAGKYARDYDFSRPFFDQFKELVWQVPKMARIQQGEMTNSRFCNCAAYNKNCYLLFSAGNNEDCLFGTFLFRCKDSVDCYNAMDSELVYNCVMMTP